MATRDPNRRVYAYEPLRRVNSGQDQFTKEAEEGAAESPVDRVREQRQLNASLNPNRKSFSSSMERFAPPPKKK